MIKKILALGGLCFAMVTSHAQQDRLYSQYMYMQQMFNPSYVGTSSNMQVTALHREQWTGVEGAPQTSAIAFSAPCKKGLGLGGSVLRDKIGVSEETSLAFDAAYKFRLNVNYTVSLGLKAELNFFSTDRTQLNIYHENEQIDKMRMSVVTPNFGFGAFIYSQNLYLGYSPTRLFKANDEVLMSTWLPQQQTHHNFMAGYVYDAGQIKVKPAALLRYVKGAPVNWHLSGNVMYKDRYVGGLSYQWRAGFSVLAAMQINKRLFAGYTFEIPLSSIQEFRAKTHELMVQFKLGNLETDANLPSARFF